MDKRNLSDRYTDLRIEKGLSQTELAKALDCNKQYISKFEDGSRALSMTMLEKYADFFGVSTDYLLGRSDVRTINEIERKICDYTGLSEKALKNITEINLTSKTVYQNNAMMEAFNYILDHKANSFFLDLMILVNESEKVFSDNEIEIPNKERNWKETTHDEQCDLLRYRLSEKFTRLLDEFDKRRIRKEEYDKLRIRIFTEYLKSEDE